MPDGDGGPGIWTRNLQMIQAKLKNEAEGEVMAPKTPERSPDSSEVAEEVGSRSTG